MSEARFRGEAPKEEWQRGEKIIIEIYDTPEGATRIDCSHASTGLMKKNAAGKLEAKSSACTYALHLLLTAIKRSRDLEESSLPTRIVLPPHLRSLS